MPGTVSAVLSALFSTSFSTSFSTDPSTSLVRLLLIANLTTYNHGPLLTACINHLHGCLMVISRRQA